MLRNGKLTHVMEQGRRLDGLELRGLGDAKSLREFDRIHLNTPDVPVSDLVFGVDRHSQCLYR